MPRKPITIWSDTPPVEKRIVAALGRIAIVMRGALWQFAAAQGLTPTQVETLLLLAARPKGARLSLVAQQLAVSAATASDAVSTLVEKELVTKDRAIDDARAVTLRLTPAGKTISKRAADATAFIEDALGPLADSHKADLLQRLLGVIGLLQCSERFPPLRTCLACEHFAPNHHEDPLVPHHCKLMDQPLATDLLRVDCPDHEPANPSHLPRNWAALG